MFVTLSTIKTAQHIRSTKINRYVINMSLLCHQYMSLVCHQYMSLIILASSLFFSQTPLSIFLSPFSGVINSLYFPLSSQVLLNIEDRALQTLPDGLIIKVSEIPDVGCGVFSRGFIPKCTRFGPYEGVIEENNAHKLTNSYSWKVGKVPHELLVDSH